MALWTLRQLVTLTMSSPPSALSASSSLSSSSSPSSSSLHWLMWLLSSPVQTTDSYNQHHHQLQQQQQQSTHNNINTNHISHINHNTSGLFPVLVTAVKQKLYHNPTHTSPQHHLDSPLASDNVGGVPITTITMEPLPLGQPLLQPWQRLLVRFYFRILPHCPSYSPPTLHHPPPFIPSLPYPPPTPTPPL